MNWLLPYTALRPANVIGTYEVRSTCFNPPQRHQIKLFLIRLDPMQIARLALAGGRARHVHYISTVGVAPSALEDGPLDTKTVQSMPCGFGCSVSPCAAFFPRCELTGELCMLC